MAQLTEHFSDQELDVAGAEQRLIDNAVFLCQNVLEPVREKFGVVRVNSAYRDPTHNAKVGGKTVSYHLFEDGRAVADTVAPAVPLPELFGWLRLESGLRFDKVLSESNAQDEPACVHIQIDRLKPPRRVAYTGGTGAATNYTKQEVK